MPKAAKQQTTTRPSPIAVKSEYADQGTNSTASDLPAKGKASASESPSPKAKRESSSKNWTAEETWQLYQLIHPKPAEVSWKELCKQFPGKDEQVPSYHRSRHRKSYQEALKRRTSFNVEY